MSFDFQIRGRSAFKLLRVIVRFLDRAEICFLKSLLKMIDLRLELLSFPVQHFFGLIVIFLLKFQLFFLSDNFLHHYLELFPFFLEL